MSIPLDRLYHYIENIAENIYGEAVIIYRFFPNGSKKLEDLMELRAYSWHDITVIPGIFCNDQEPLDYEYYETCYSPDRAEWYSILKSCPIKFPRKNLNTRNNIYDQAFLLHSEQRSNNLKAYQASDWITVYYWSHALLALDWFRYAKHISVKKESTTQFLIYNRAWSGTREYRLKFADLLIDNNLVVQCKMSIGFIDNTIHYRDHLFKNLHWKPTHTLENYFVNNITPSTASADFVLEDYSSTDIEIVLETLFEDDRLHLTEKSLRPIALRQPFMLVATYGSLEYLRSYGFKTFDPIIDESYDTIKDPVKRLDAIVQVMQKISQWTDSERIKNMTCLQEIADYNYRYFFSAEFSNLIINELKNNLKEAVSEFNSKKSYYDWINHWDQLLLTQSVQDFINKNQDTVYPTKQQVDIVYSKAKNYHLVSR